MQSRMGLRGAIPTESQRLTLADICLSLQRKPPKLASSLTCALGANPSPALPARGSGTERHKLGPKPNSYREVLPG